MKKLSTILALVLSLVVSLCVSACFGGGNKVTYTLDSSKFETTVVYGSAIDYADFAINGSDGKTIAVTESMVSGWDTATVGAKTLTVTYKEMKQAVNYTVKYEVKFNVNGQNVATQYVLNASELTVPAGYEFTIPSNVAGNLELSGSAVSNVEISIGDEASELYVGAAGVNLPVSVTGVSDWNVETSNDNLSVRKMSGMVLIEAKKVGITDLIVKAGGVSESKTIVIKPTSLTINESARTYGIENLLTIGRTDADGAISDLSLSVSCANAGAGFAENVVWTSNNEKAAIENGEITLSKATGAEVVTFTADFHGVKESFDVRCVFDGVNVFNYADLYKASEASQVIVLGADIAFPTKASDIKYKTIHTTYDDGYYTNISNLDAATINVLIQFRNNVYGNGFEINAHNATLGLLDSTGALTADSIFRGPLDFVSLTEQGASAASVKGQDNVCFAVYENVTINNVILKAANLEKDLTELNYAGTTVEVFGDNVNIEYSRLMNGRTVLRVFGDAEKREKVINVNVKNSVLSGAREFILRMGSNDFLPGVDGNESPYLYGEELDLVGIKSGAVAKPDGYEEDYIRTFVNVTNCVFKDAGIFAVGIDSHFAGHALHHAGMYESIFAGFKYWRNLAKTSYGAKLTFNGEVKLYNWKNLEDINSSTLIELNTSVLGESIIELLTFDVGSLVKTAADKRGNGTIIVQKGEESYVHAGIAYFGGGKNYGLFEDNANMNLEGFEISLADVEKSTLVNAAGAEPFYFNIYDSTTTGFTYEMQENMSEADMYACIYNK